MQWAVSVVVSRTSVRIRDVQVAAFPAENRAPTVEEYRALVAKMTEEREQVRETLSRLKVGL